MNAQRLSSSRLTTHAAATATLQITKLVSIATRWCNSTRLALRWSSARVPQALARDLDPRLSAASSPAAALGTSQAALLTHAALCVKLGERVMPQHLSD